ncbi:hypothetical protein [Absidia glauca]|uniref:HMG box domain-containing protein n=1 Tax=Absidia glauca TaxID=4829 RepID=A0A163KC97_ABSGL|nr:hypothetical protein [Absidia glauca]
MTTTTTATKKISRPINCFMTFRLEKYPEIQRQSPKMNHRDISKVIAKWWKEMSDHEKEPYRIQAFKAKAEHEKKYPDYKYRPIKRSERKVRRYRRREDAETRRRKAKQAELSVKPWLDMEAPSAVTTPSSTSSISNYFTLGSPESTFDLDNGFSLFSFNPSCEQDVASWLDMAQCCTSLDMLLVDPSPILPNTPTPISTYDFFWPYLTEDFSNVPPLYGVDFLTS